MKPSAPGEPIQGGKTILRLSVKFSAEPLLLLSLWPLLAAISALVGRGRAALR